MFEKVDAYTCTKCGKLYVKERPMVCSCTSSLEEGKVVGCFELISRLPDRKWEAICLVCGLTTTISATNLRRQKSCGCKPKRAEILAISMEEVRYRCKKCGTSYVEDLPVMLWCCDGVED